MSFPKRLRPALSAGRRAFDPAAAEQAISGVADGRLAWGDRAWRLVRTTGEPGGKPARPQRSHHRRRRPPLGAGSNSFGLVLHAPTRRRADRLPAARSFTLKNACDRSSKADAAFHERLRRRLWSRHGSNTQRHRENAAGNTGVAPTLRSNTRAMHRVAVPPLSAQRLVRRPR